MSTDNDLLLLVAYSKAFGNITLFVEEKFPLDECFKTLVERNVIDDRCRRNIKGAKSINREREILLEYLQEKNDVEIYDKFLEVCDTADPELANFIKDTIDEAKERDAGLSASYHYLERNKNFKKKDYEKGTEDESLLILSAYSKVFTENFTFIKTTFNNRKYATGLYESQVIDDDCKTAMIGAPDNESASKIMLDFLRRQNKVQIYNLFLNYCDTIHPEFGLKLRKKIAWQKERFGLSSTCGSSMDQGKEEPDGEIGATSLQHL